MSGVLILISIEMCASFIRILVGMLKIFLVGNVDLCNYLHMPVCWGYISYCLFLSFCLQDFGNGYLWRGLT